MIAVLILLLQGAESTNISHTIEGTVLRISGTGEMSNYTEKEPPWTGFYDMETVVLENEITSVGERAFTGCGSLVTVSLGTGVASIGKFAFAFCPRLTTVQILRSSGVWLGYGSLSY